MLCHNFIQCICTEHVKCWTVSLTYNYVVIIVLATCMLETSQYCTMYIVLDSNGWTGAVINEDHSM